LTELAGQVNDPLLAAGAVVLPRLREITGESVQLYRREGTSRICVAALEPPAGLRDTVPVGTRLPMTAGSGAKVLLAYADAATQQAVLPAAMFTDRALAEVRKRGWAQSAAEREPGVASVSATVRDGRCRDRRGVGVRADRPDGTPTRCPLGQTCWRRQTHWPAGCNRREVLYRAS
jgi:DNA-binding IclR family transcriptional regulator